MQRIVKWAIAGLVILLLVPITKNFIRARSEKAKNPCIVNLKQIEGAREQWRLENRKAVTDIPAWSDITPYLKNDKIPVCPQGGVYVIGKGNESPRCSIGGQGHSISGE